jgi:TPR repeat protein
MGMGRSRPALVNVELVGQIEIFETAAAAAPATGERLVAPPLAELREAPAPGAKSTAAQPARAPSAEAGRWLLAAAEAGLAEAQFEYGRLLLNKENAAQVPGLGFSPKRAVFWLSRAAEQGHAQAAYELGLVYRNSAFAQQNAATSNQWMGAAARLGHALGQYEYGAYLWRRRVSLGALADVEAASWLSRAKYQGVTAATDLLEKIVDPLPSVSPQTALARRTALRAAAQANQCLALRLELAGSFGLRKGEAFFFDPATAIHDGIVLIDVRAEVGKTRRRLFEIEGEGQAALLRRMQMMFGSGNAPEADLQGDYGRRHAQMDAFCKKLGIDDELFFAARQDAATERAEEQARAQRVKLAA